MHGIEGGGGGGIKKIHLGKQISPALHPPSLKDDRAIEVNTFEILASKMPNTFQVLEIV